MPIRYGVDAELDRIFRNITLEQVQNTPTPEQLERYIRPEAPEQAQPVGTLPPSNPFALISERIQGYIQAKKIREYLEANQPTGTISPAIYSVPTPEKQLEETTKAAGVITTMFEKPVSALLTAKQRGGVDFTVTPPEEFLPGGEQYEAYEAQKLPFGVKGGLELVASAPFFFMGSTAKGLSITAKNTPKLFKFATSMKTLPTKIIKGETNWQKFLRGMEEKVTDKFAGINKLSGRAKKALGNNIPDELDAELQVALMAGVPEAALTTSRQVYRQAIKTLGGDIDSGFVSNFLRLRHQKDILAMHPKRLITGGLKESQIDDLLGEMTKVLGPQRMQRVESAAGVIREHYIDLLNRKVASGLVEEELANVLKTQYPWYNPIKYIDHLAEATGAGSKRISVTANGLKRLSEMGSEVATEDPLNVLVNATLKSELLIHRNNTAKAIIKIAQEDPQLVGLVKKVKITKPVAIEEGKVIFRPTKGEIPGTVSFMEKGVRQVYEVPRWLEKEMKYLTSLPPTDLEAVFSAVNNISRFGMTTANLAFFIPNLAVDSLTAMLTRGVGPLRLGKRLLMNLKAIIAKGGDETLEAMLKAKGGLSGFWGKAPEQIAKDIRKSGQLVLHSEEDLTRFLKNPIKLIMEIGHAVEMTPRTAVFEAALKKGKSLEKAALEARRVTIDFARTGSAVRHANYMYLYLNAGLQGSLIPFRALRDYPRSRAFIAGLMAITMGNYAWNRQFPEYDDVPDYAKYGSYLFMLPSEEYDKYGNKVPHFISVIPNMREWALFTAPIIYAMRKLDERAPEDVQQFLNALVPGVNPFSQISGEGGIPIPTQMGQALVEGLVMNKDLFRDRDIVPIEYQGLPPEDQYDEYTSLTAKRVGQFLGFSPMKLDFFVRSILGGVGSQFLETADAVIRRVAPEEVSPHIMSLYEQLQQIVPPNVAPEEVSRKRDEFLYALPSEEREAVLKLERQPEERIPIITTIQRRLYRESGGQLYKTGKALGEKETGISAEQTQQASRIMGKVSGELQASQEQLDNAVRNGSITMKQWRESRADFGKLYQGSLMAVGILFPISAQGMDDPDLWNDYLTAIYTLASTMPDRRSRGDLLMAGYRSITPEETAPGQMDWDKFFDMREQFMKNLISDDRTLLEEEIKSRMSPLERTYFDLMQNEKISIYYRLPEGKVRSEYRSMNPDLDATLNFVGFAESFQSQLAVIELKKLTDKYGLPFAKMPAVEKVLTEQEGTTSGRTRAQSPNDALKNIMRR